MLRAATTYAGLAAMLAFVLAGCAGTERIDGTDLITTTAAAPQFETAAEALVVAGLQEELTGAGPYTFFAPTEEAWEDIPAETRRELLDPENREDLVEIMRYHIVPGAFTSDELLARSTAVAGEVTLTTLQGNEITVNGAVQGVLVDDGAIVQPDIMAANGVIHAVDQVLLPPAMDQLTHD